MAARIHAERSSQTSKTVSESFLRTLSTKVSSKRQSCISNSSEESSLTLHKLNLGSSRIYGRETEISCLKDAFESVSNESIKDPTKLVWITGQSGTGKSVLATTLNDQVKQKGGFFVTGKFDLQQRVEPYTAFSTAFTELCNSILDKPAELRSELVEKIKKAVGSEGQVLTDMITDLEVLIGPQDATTESGSKEARNRLHFLLRKFTGAVCSPSHPLVLVLDDLQWADAASLELLETLVTDSKNHSLLIIGTSRDNEVDENHILSKQLETLQASHVTVSKIQCENLGVLAVNSLVSDALRSSEEVTKPLADIVHRKTLGNAFFVVQFLRRIYDENILTYNFGLMKWSWDDCQIQSMNVTDNIVDLMIDKIQKLPPKEQFVVQVASCLGQTFPVNTLALVMERLNEKTGSDTNELVEATNQGQSISQVVVVLETLRGDGFLEKDAEGRHAADAIYYSFVHDQIQNAALRLIPAEKRSQLQLFIGEVLLGDEASEDLFLLAVDLCNRGASSIPNDSKEKIKLADRNKVAGERAMKNGAFLPAATYFDTGLTHLGSSTDDPSQYMLTMQLLSASAEAQYCNGRFDAMEPRLDQAIAKARTFDDKIRPYLTLILSCAVQEERRERGIDTAFYVLEEMGMVKFPKTVGKWTVLLEIMKMKRLFKSHTQESLSNLPVMQDEKRESAMRILEHLVTMTYYSRPEYVPLIILRMTRWSVKYGVCKHAPPAFSFYGLLLCGTGDLKTGFMFGEIALSLLDRLKCQETMSRTIFHVYGFVHHWSKDEHSSIKPLLYGHQVGMETGDIEQAVYNIDCYVIAAYYTSRRLDILEKEVEGYYQLMRDYKQESCRLLMGPKWQSILNLLGRCEDPLVLTGKAMNQEEMTKLAKETNNRLLEAVVDAYRLPLAYILRDYELADELSDRTRDIGDPLLVGHIFVPRHLFYAGLTALAMAQLKPETPSKVQLRHAEKIMRKMKHWIRSGNVTCVHMFQLLEAELAIVKGKYDLAKDHFNESISSAARAGYIQDRALAHERAGLFFQNCSSDKYWAAYHFERAVEWYDEWGAKAKVRQMVEKHSAFLTEFSGSSSFL